MLATSATRPARLSETMRRVRLENESAKKNCPARFSQDSGRQPCATCTSSAGRSGPPGDATSSAAGFESDCVRSSNAYARVAAGRAMVPVSWSSVGPDGSRTVRASGFLEAVADAVQRFDHLEIVVGYLELLAQPLDVAVDGAVVDIDLVVIGRVHQRVAALHHARPRRQRLEDQEFRHGQRDRLVLPGAGVALRIHP